MDKIASRAAHSRILHLRITQNVTATTNINNVVHLFCSEFIETKRYLHIGNNKPITRFVVGICSCWSSNESLWYVFCICAFTSP